MAPSEACDLRVAVIRLPNRANVSDAAALHAEPDVAIHYVDNANGLAGADMIILPGSTNTVFDLAWLKNTGLAAGIRDHVAGKGATVGICGGYQMLGRRLAAADGQEDKPGMYEGLGLLPVDTLLLPRKETTRTVVTGLTGLLGAWSKGIELSGCEVQSGQTTLLPGGRPAFRVLARNGQVQDDTDGCTERGGWLFGTNVEGVFDNHRFRRNYLNALRARRGLPPVDHSS